jgi:hypothetical protein
MKLDVTAEVILSQLGYSNNEASLKQAQKAIDVTKGYEKFANGSVYKGDYVQGKPEGCGRYEWENG